MVSGLIIWVNIRSRVLQFAIQLLGERKDQEDSYGLIHFGPQNDTGFGIIVADSMGGHKIDMSQTAVDSARLILRTQTRSLRSPARDSAIV